MMFSLLKLKLYRVIELFSRASHLEIVDEEYAEELKGDSENEIKKKTTN